MGLNHTTCKRKMSITPTVHSRITCQETISTDEDKTEGEENCLIRSQYWDHSGNYRHLKEQTMQRATVISFSNDVAWKL